MNYDLNPDTGFTADVIRETNRFVGRTQEVSACVRALNNPLSLIAVYGKRGVGKSSILRQIQKMANGDYEVAKKAGIFHEVPAKPRTYLTVYYQCDAMITDTGALLSRICNDNDPDDGLLRLVPHSGKSIQEFKRIGANDNASDLRVVDWGRDSVSISNYTRHIPGDIVQTFRNFIQQIVNEQVQHRMKRDGLLILIDEFDVIQNNQAFASLVKSLTSNTVKFGICGIANDIYDLVKDHASIPRLLEQGIVKVNKMGDSESKEIYSTAEKLYNQQLRFHQDVVTKLVKYSDGYPYLAQSLGKECVVKALLLGRDLIDEEVLRAVLSEIQTGKAFPQLEQAYQTAIGNSEGRKLILHYLAEQDQEEALFNNDDIGRVVLRKLRDEEEIKNIDQLVPRLVDARYGPVLNRLPERQGTYEFVDPVFRLYVRLRNI